MTHEKLVHEITAQDRKDSTKKNYNPYALAMMLGAAADCMEQIEAGFTPETAFTGHFTPTRENHAIAKRLGLKLHVERGRWQRIATAVN